MSRSFLLELTLLTFLPSRGRLVTNSGIEYTEIGGLCKLMSQLTTVQADAPFQGACVYARRVITTTTTAPPSTAAPTTASPTEVQTTTPAPFEFCAVPDGMGFVHGGDTYIQ